MIVSLTSSNRAGDLWACTRRAGSHSHIKNWYTQIPYHTPNVPERRFDKTTGESCVLASTLFVCHSLASE